MKVIYEAFDGKRFEEKRDCLVYEQAHGGTVKMWNEDGTTDAESATVVYLGSEDDAGGNRFIDMCDDMLASYSGLTKDIDNPEFGWWYWDDFDNIYRYIGPDVRKALINAYKWNADKFLSSI